MSKEVPLPVDDPAPAASDSVAGEIVPLAEREASEAPTEGIWAWVERLEGERLTRETLEALEELAESRSDESAVEDEVLTTADPEPVEVDPSDPLRLKHVNPDDYDIPMVMNRDVQRWMRYFLGRGRPHFQRYMARSHIYEPMMRQKLEAAGLPGDLVYLALIESGFNAHALSHAGAGGLWQFMPATGRMYDLRVDWWVDDRRDPIKSTDAAIAHLADLHRMFDGDWYLAWSAYNAGPGRVRRAMKSAGSKDFWTLARGRHLPVETANYPPKLLAAAILAKNAEAYDIVYKPQPRLAVEVVKVDGAANLDLLAECAGVDVDTLKYLNPGLRRWATPSEGYLLNVPSGKVSSFQEKFAAVPRTERVRYGNHVVRKGETLGRIAAQHGVSVAEIVSLNHLKDANRIVVGMSLLVPRPDASVPVARPTAVAEATPAKSAPVASAPNAAAAKPAAAASTAVRYEVRRGDTLSGIASRYGVSVRDLQAWNGLKASTIRVGQRLEIRRPTWREVEVARGDSLGRIASREGCSVRDLQSWNSLSGDVIHPGQVLRIRQ